MLTKRRRRSGVSSVIGAIFFILVVFLVFSATVLVFQTFSGYSLVVKQVDQQDAQNKVTDAGISALAFGGLPPSAVATETLSPAALNTLVPTRSLLPIFDMNFSNNMNGWVFSRSYKIVRDDGYVTNTFLNVLPGGTVFTLAVSNADPVGSCPITSCITKVTLQVDSRFSLTGLPIPLPPVGWNAPTVSGNTITWNAVSVPTQTGLPPGSMALFNWTALAPGVPGEYFQTATVTWLTIFHGVQISDQGSVTVATNVVTGGPGGVSIPTLCALPAPPQSNICAEPAGVIPGGAVGGYDPISNVVGSESGPGSVYLNFQPTYNGTAITGGQQMTAVMNFTSVFTLDAGQVGALATGTADDAVNFGFSLDQVTAPPQPLILIYAYLVQLNPANGVNDIIQIPNQTPVVPTQVNNFNSSGWITCGPTDSSCTEPYFNPAALATAQHALVPWVWKAGQYELVISVDASLPGATPPSGNYPSSLLMHFDDIGLALQDTPASYFVDNSVPNAGCVPASASCLLQIPFSTVPSQLQSIQLTTSVSLSPAATQNVTAYVFLGDVSRGTATPVWVEVGQLELSSSATVSVTIPAASASNFIDSTGRICGAPVAGICLRVYAISDGNKAFSYNFGSLTISASAVLQTFQYNSVTLTLFNNSTIPIAFTNVYINGPDGVSSYGLTPNLVPPYYCAGAALVTPGSITPCYVDAGQTVVLQLPFVWKTDQAYVATVVTNKGLSFSESFISP